jgi:Family of unknown function (DUF5719)
MKGRGQLLAAVVVAAVVVAAAVGLQHGLGTKAFATAPPAVAPSGAWFCPHGGGAGWRATLQVANPGSRSVAVRVTSVSEGRPPSVSKTYTVDAGTELALAANAASRGSSSLVEYFGGWVAAGWVARAGGGESGVASEPCAPAAGRTWLLPDGSTQLAEQATAAKNRPTLDSYVVLMNPFATDAIVSLTLYTDEDAPVHPGVWTHVVLKPFRSRAFLLNDQRLGFGTVSASVDAEVGRVVASSLDVNQLGGIRSAMGQRPPTPGTAVLPGGFDQGRTELVVMNPTANDAQPTGTVLGRSEPVPVDPTSEDRVNPQSAQTFAVTTEGASALAVHVPSGTAVVRRTFGQSSDQAATDPAPPAAAWLVLPAVAGSPSHPGLAIANPGSEPVDVSISHLSEGGSISDAITLHVPGLREVAAPTGFLEAHPSAAILATSEDGTFVPASASYSLGRDGDAGYAVALGVQIPAAWVPTAP